MFGANRWTAVLSLIAVAVVATAIVLSSGGTGYSYALTPDNVAVVERGKEVYARHCAACHGKELEGQPNWRVRDEEGYLPAPPHDATGHTWHHTDKKLFELTKYGLADLAGDDYKTQMPAYDGILSDQDIIAVLSFIKSRWPSNIRKRHDRLNSARRR